MHHSSEMKEILREHEDIAHNVLIGNETSRLSVVGGANAPESKDGEQDGNLLAKEWTISYLSELEDAGRAMRRNGNRKFL